MFRAGQIKVRFKVIPFKFETGEILFKVHLTREFPSPSYPTLVAKHWNDQKSYFADLEASTMVSQTRLENRTFRPNVELCRDRAQYQREKPREKLKILKWKQAVFLLTEIIVRSCANRSIMYLIERVILGDMLPQFQDIEIDHVLHMFSSWVH